MNGFWARCQMWMYLFTFREFNGGGPRGCELLGVICSVKVGKKKADRLLDEREYNEIPDCLRL